MERIDAESENCSPIPRTFADPHRLLYLDPGQGRRGGGGESIPPPPNFFLSKILPTLKNTILSFLIL